MNRGLIFALAALAALALLLAARACAVVPTENPSARTA